MGIPQKSYPVAVDGSVSGLSTLNGTRTWRLKNKSITTVYTTFYNFLALVTDLLTMYKQWVSKKKIQPFSIHFNALNLKEGVKSKYITLCVNGCLRKILKKAKHHKESTK